MTGIVWPLGLCAEQYDTCTDRRPGNFPLAFAHLPPFESAGRIGVSAVLAELS